MADIPDNTPTRARLIPRHRWPEVVAYRLGTGMVSMLTAAAWIRERRDDCEVPYCDDTGLLLRHDDGEEATWNEWISAGSVLIWSPPGTKDGGLFGEVALDYFDDYEVIEEGDDV